MSSRGVVSRVVSRVVSLSSCCLSIVSRVGSLCRAFVMSWCRASCPLRLVSYPCACLVLLSCLRVRISLPKFVVLFDSTSPQVDLSSVKATH